MERIIQEGGFDNMDFDGFMQALDSNNIDPGEFSEQMRSLADVMMPDEGGAAKLDQDVLNMVEQVTREHMEAEGHHPQSASKDIWTESEVEQLEAEPEHPQESGPDSVLTPEHRVEVIRGADLDGDVVEVVIGLPLLDSIADVDLEVESRTLSLEVEARYHLELALEHCVDEDEVQARFDKSAKELVIRAPIKYD